MIYGCPVDVPHPAMYRMSCVMPSVGQSLPSKVPLPSPCILPCNLLFFVIDVHIHLFYHRTAVTHRTFPPSRRPFSLVAIHCTYLTDFDEPPLSVIRIENVDYEAEVPRNPLSLYSRSCDYDDDYDYLSKCDMFTDWCNGLGLGSSGLDPRAGWVTEPGDDIVPRVPRGE